MATEQKRDMLNTPVCVNKKERKKRKRLVVVLSDRKIARTEYDMPNNK